MAREKYFWSEEIDYTSESYTKTLTFNIQMHVSQASISFTFIKDYVKETRSDNKQMLHLFQKKYHLIGTNNLWNEMEDYEPLTCLNFIFQILQSLHLKHELHVFDYE